MAQQDLGGSCTAHKYCHSEARISGQFCALHLGVSLKKPTMSVLTRMIRRRQSSYSQSERSTPSGGVASLIAPALSSDFELFSLSCVSLWCSAFRYSCNWKGESIC